MSEPVIKAKAWVCADCGSTWSIGDRNGEYCCSRDKKIEEAYTRDDLVAVARWTLDYFSAVSKEDVQDEANDVVERLTGVKR